MDKERIRQILDQFKEQSRANNGVYKLIIMTKSAEEVIDLLELLEMYKEARDDMKPEDDIPEDEQVEEPPKQKSWVDEMFDQIENAPIPADGKIVIRW